ncbi:hypothetical protein AA15669_1656 [Saccharibacter floricola DSM 15669]|uniref:Uncharacterized protein n=1 Tax=Saccharibacter floricola DSM 15669 TaxID=1123227 RepID=A0ABQ0P0D2_9PROT|nr:hypothetical protein AA15669_1656 [Saccharibacter floricola DSM 15669]
MGCRWAALLLEGKAEADTCQRAMLCVFRPVTAIPVHSEDLRMANLVPNIESLTVIDKTISNRAGHIEMRAGRCKGTKACIFFTTASQSA